MPSRGDRTAPRARRSSASRGLGAGPLLPGREQRVQPGLHRLGPGQAAIHQLGRRHRARVEGAPQLGEGTEGLGHRRYPSSSPSSTLGTAKAEPSRAGALATAVSGG